MWSIKRVICGHLQSAPDPRVLHWPPVSKHDARLRRFLASGDLWPLTFQLKIGTLLTRALGKVFVNFFVLFELRVRTGQTDSTRTDGRTDGRAVGLRVMRPIGRMHDNIIYYLWKYCISIQVKCSVPPKMCQIRFRPGKAPDPAG